MKAQQINKSKQEMSIRWAILVFAIASSFGVEFSFDNPSVLKDLLFQRFNNIYDQEEFEIVYSLLYSCLAVPNVVVPFLIGYLIDRLGVRNLYAGLAIFSMIGQSLVAVGVHALNFFTICSGRMILGMACESMAIIQGIFLSQYFGKEHLSSVVGGIYCLANLGGVINAYFTPRIAVEQGLTQAFWVGSFLCIVIGIMTLIACALDRKTESFIKKSQSSELTQGTNTSSLPSSEENEALIIHNHNTVQDESHVSQNQESGLTGLKSFPPIFWYLCIGTFLIQASILSFNVIGASYFTTKWFSNEGLRRATEDSGAVFSMFRFSSCIFSPILGYIVDKTGQRSGFFVLACFLAMCSHIMVIIVRPFVPCVMFGIAFTLIYTVCWPSVMMLVKEENVGKACGLVTSLENVGLVLLPLVDGVLKNTFGSYDDSEMFLALVAFIGLSCGVKMLLLDKQQGGILKGSAEKKIE